MYNVYNDYALHMCSVYIAQCVHYTLFTISNKIEFTHNCFKVASLTPTTSFVALPSFFTPPDSFSRPLNILSGQLPSSKLIAGISHTFFTPSCYPTYTTYIQTWIFYFFSYVFFLGKCAGTQGLFERYPVMFIIHFWFLKFHLTLYNITFVDIL